MEGSTGVRIPNEVRDGGGAVLQHDSSVTNESGMDALALEVTRDFVEEAGDVCRVVVECDGVTE